MGGYSWFLYFVGSVPELLMVVFFGMQLSGALRKITSKQLFLIGILPSFVVSLYYWYTRASLLFIPMMYIHCMVVLILVTWSSYYIIKNYYKSLFCGFLSFIPLLATEAVLMWAHINFLGEFSFFTNKLGVTVLLISLRYIPVFGIIYFLNRKDVTVIEIKDWVRNVPEKIRNGRGGHLR